jgi:hypothetical protein
MHHQLKSLNFHSLDEYRCHYKSIPCKNKKDCKQQSNCYFYHEKEEYISPSCFYYYRENKDKKNYYAPCKFGKDCETKHVKEIPYINTSLKELILKICYEKKIDKEREIEREREREREYERERDREREYERERKRQRENDWIESNKRMKYEKENQLHVLFSHNSQLVEEHKILSKNCKDFEIVVQTCINKINEQYKMLQEKDALIKQKDSILYQKNLECETLKCLLAQYKK